MDAVLDISAITVFLFIFLFFNWIERDIWRQFSTTWQVQQMTIFAKISTTTKMVQ